MKYPLPFKKLPFKKPSFKKVLRRVVWVAVTAALGTALGATVVVVPHAAADDISGSSRNYGKGWKACTRTLNGVRTTVAKNQRTVTIVNQRAKTYADIAFYVRVNGQACKLDRLFRGTGARLGYGGTVAGSKRKQGTGTTPLGTYTMTRAFGIKADPGSWIPYHKVKAGDFWVEDNTSKYYNDMRNKSQGGFHWRLPASNPNSSERLLSFPGQYDYAIVINYNRPHPVKHRGAGIFLHVNGSGPTAGCVSTSEQKIKIVLAYLRSGDKIVIHQ